MTSQAIQDKTPKESSSYELRRLCYAYIDRVLDGYWGNQARAECHMEFIKLFSQEDWMLLSNELLDILHNLDREVGLSFDGANGQDVPPAHRKRYARLLFQRLKPLTKGGDERRTYHCYSKWTFDDAATDVEIDQVIHGLEANKEYNRGECYTPDAYIRMCDLDGCISYIGKVLDAQARGEVIDVEEELKSSAESGKIIVRRVLEKMNSTSD